MILGVYLLVLVFKAWDVRYGTCLSSVCRDEIDPWSSLQTLLRGLADV